MTHARVYAFQVLVALLPFLSAFAAENEIVGARSALFAGNFVQGVVGITFDAEGHMYVATHGDKPEDIGKIGDKKVVRLSPDGTRSTIASYRCFAFQYLKYQRDGSILASVVNDALSGRGEVVKISQDGHVTTVSDGFTQPGGITFDLSGNLYVVDAQSNIVYRIDSSGNKTIFIDINGTARISGKCYFHGLEYDSVSNSIYTVGLAEGQGRGKILKYPLGKDGSPGLPVVIAEPYNAMHITLDGYGNAFATVNKNSILYIRENGTAKEFVCQGAYFEGVALSLGGNGFDQTSLYVNARDKIMRVDFLTASTSMPNTLIFPRVVQTADESFGVAVVNYSNDDTHLTFTAYDDNGNLVSGSVSGKNPAVVMLPPAEQFVAVGPELLGDTFNTQGSWLQMTSERKDVAGFFLTFDPALLTMDGTDVNGRILTSLIFPEAAEGEISLINANENQQAEVTISLYDDEGTVQGPSLHRSIGPRARYSASLPQLFPSLATGAAGYVSVTSSLGLAGLQVAGRRDIYSWALQAANGNRGARTLYSPQFVTGFGYRSCLEIVNLDILPASVTLKWINDEGHSVGLPASFTIPPRGRKVISDPSYFQAGAPNAGYISVESDRLLTGAVFFGDENGTQMQTALPLATAGLEDIIYSQVAQNDVYYTGLAVINPGAADARITISIYDELGREKGSGSEKLAPGCRFSKLLTQIVPDAPAMSRGYFRVKSDQPIFSFAVFGTRTFSVLSAIPAQAVEP
jgi:hypothetical protein